MVDASHAADTTLGQQQTHTYNTTLQNARADPLAQILNDITKNSVAYVTRQTTNHSEQSNTKQKEEEEGNEHHSMDAKNITRQTHTKAVEDNRTIIKDGDTVRTGSGCISKKLDRIGIQIIINTGPTNMSAMPTNVLWPAAVSHDSKHLFV